MRRYLIFLGIGLLLIFLTQFHNNGVGDDLAATLRKAGYNVTAVAVYGGYKGSQSSVSLTIVGDQPAAQAVCSAALQSVAFGDANKPPDVVTVTYGQYSTVQCQP